ncbi:hypothetical protein DFJ58DRAFT_911668 [Suillus subalutaceus]|uniref:uncharacterized protein n=1 Tax=Suillus subalutaceus TaxID=48586 RepID=UPI001B87DF56|nr:uncharacterized protein DFJ58DRAFT_911668 [Suillus subalutaceus]KAG1867240.1 hypothetical protein DFJ58DRAFT_911668 [Suillus subalutaceus]
MPSPDPPLKDLIKNFFKNLHLGEVFAVRSRRPAKNGRAQRSLTTIHHEPRDNFIPVDIPNEIPVPSPTLHSNPSLLVHPDPLAISSSTSSRGNSSTRLGKASDVAQTFLPIVQAVTGPIPLVGAPINATISGLLAILQVIDRRSQNRADLDRLASRLHQLSSHLCNAPTSQDPIEQYRRDSIIRMLQDISAQVTQLYNRGLAYTSVAQAIIGCSSEIDRYLADYSVVFYSLKILSSQMQIQHDIHEMRKTIERQQETLIRFESVFFHGQSVGPNVTLGCVKLVDATDHLHAIPMDVCDSFERFNEMLQLLLKHDSVEARIQRRYMEQGQYDLCMDDDNQVTRLTSHEWPRITAGMTIVMRVVFERETYTRVDYSCLFCGAVNDVGAGSIMHSIQRQAGCSIDCRNCKRRFQISLGSSSAKRNTQSYDTDSVTRTEEEMDLIRNFHVQETFRPVNEEARDFNAGGASTTVYSHRAHNVLGHGPIISRPPGHVSPSHAKYGYNRIGEIEEDSNDDEDEDGAEGLDDEEWEDCEDGKDSEETNHYGEL